MKHYLFNTLLVLVLSVQIGNAYARGKTPRIDSSNVENLPDQANPYVEGEKWAETDVKLPPYPDDGDLIDLHLDDPRNKFEYYIDEKSLSVSDKDFVVRYTMVIEGKRGTRNVFYEGVLCNTLEYKTYAFGSGKGKLRARKKPEWKSLKSSKGNGFNKFRLDLMDLYLCQRDIPRQREIIVNRIKHAAPHEDYRDVYNR
jgi:CNP1-like family